ncbi:preprotein translocase subunit SecE [bacterium]|nr:preprotein translocase subunit SecE [bacterium]
MKKISLKRIGLFLKETKIEMKRVNWLTKKQATKYTFYVLLFSFAMAIYLAVLDYLFTFILMSLKF